MEHSTGKDKGKDANAKNQAEPVDPAVASRGEDIDLADMGVKLTKEQREAQAFKQLNTELYVMEDNFKPDIEGKTTLDAIKAGLSKIAP